MIIVKDVFGAIRKNERKTDISVHLGDASSTMGGKSYNSLFLIILWLKIGHNII